MSYASGTEPEIVARLRDKGALSLSLVCEQAGMIVGHIAFSPADQSNAFCSWFALGPVSVIPKYQCKGIGSDLIVTGLDELKRGGAAGCILVGNPKYYSRFGFELSPEYAPEGESEEYFMVKYFGDARPVGSFSFDPAFYTKV